MAGLAGASSYGTCGGIHAMDGWFAFFSDKTRQDSESDSRVITPTPAPHSEVKPEVVPYILLDSFAERSLCQISPQSQPPT
ncbi:hypothetical protein E4U30_008282, partial [Claviceps sp. LM220 group G6]